MSIGRKRQKPKQRSAAEDWMLADEALQALTPVIGRTFLALLEINKALATMRLRSKGRFVYNIQYVNQAQTRGEQIFTLSANRLGDGAVDAFSKKPASGMIDEEGELSTDFWHEFALVLRPNNRCCVPERRPGASLKLGGDAYIYLSRRDLLKLWPAAADEMTGPRKTVAPSEAVLPRRKPGPRTEYDWAQIDAEIARCCCSTGQVKVPARDALIVEQLLQWCENKWGRQPALSEIRERVRVILTALKTVEK